MSFPSVRPSILPGRLAVTPSAASSRRAYRQVAAASVVLIALAWQLPGPAATIATLFDEPPIGTTAGVADAAMLSLAAMSVWLLLGWLVLVGGVAAASRLPGMLGSAAGAGLRALAPVAVRNVVLGVVGASVVTGLAGCATGSPAVTAATGPGAGVAATAVATAAAAAAPPSSATPTCAANTVRSTPGAAQLHAERLIGIATLRISDSIAVEGSAVGTGAAVPAGGRAMPDVDWPATGRSAEAGAPAGRPAAGAPAKGAPTAGAPTAGGPAAGGRPPAADARPATSDGSGASVAARTATPAISVDWPEPAPRSATAADASVVVLRGDSLWSIAARSLPSGADDAEIDRTWRAWYAANTSVIGSDPDYLLPGQILQPPTSGTSTSR